MHRFIIALLLLSGVIAACKKHNIATPATVISTPHQWRQITAPVNGDNSDIYFTSKDTGYIFGTAANNYVLRSTDGGMSWNVVINFSARYPSFNCFYALNSKSLFALRDTLYTSADGGSTWFKSMAWSGTTAYCVAFTDNQTGFILTNDKIYSTIDEGVTWNLAASLNGSFTNLVFPDKIHGFASGGGEIEDNANNNITSVGSLSATADGGRTWTQLDTGSWINGTQRFKKITAIDFSDAASGVIAMEDITLSATKDNGLHWQITNKNLPGIMWQIKYDKAGKLFFISGNKVYSSDNNGQTIGLEFSGTDEFLKIGVTPDNRIFLVGRDGQIYERM